VRPHAGFAVAYGDIAYVGVGYPERTIAHEAGHIEQAEEWGPAFTLLVAIPSVVSAFFDDPVKHPNRWFELDATRRGAE